MITDTKHFPLAEAEYIAQRTMAQLAPHCLRIAIAGSIRRQKPYVKDIELLIIPKPYSIGIFADGIAPIVEQWPKVKGELGYGTMKYTQRILSEGIKLDLFVAEPQNWGLILAIRTGSAEYSHKVLANGWVRAGYRSEGGYLYHGETRYNIYEERDLFERIGIPYTEPTESNL